MNRLRAYLRRRLERPLVRPLALAGPVLVLVIALPLLRPLRHAGETSNDEALRMATIRALVEHRSLSLDRSWGRVPGVIPAQRTGNYNVYSAQPPMMSLLLSVPAWVMNRAGLSFDDNQVLMPYLLTLLGVTLPVAGAAGLIYRMGRLFELRRPWRAAMGFAVVAGSGLLSYAVVLNPYAPAAVLVLSSAACLIHVAAMNRDDRRAGWFALAGACAALATTIDPPAVALLALFLFVIPAMRFSLGRRMSGVLLYVLGAIPVISLHAAWNIPMTGDIVPASVEMQWSGEAAAMSMAPQATELRPIMAMTEAPGAAAPAAGTVSATVAASAAWDVLEEEEDARPTWPAWRAVGGHLLWMLEAAVGEHGLLSHFPVLILGVLGVGAVMHRHWPSSTKLLAAATLAGAVGIIAMYRAARVEWSGAMFASKWFIVFMPLLLFWGGAWLRRAHTPAAWSWAGALVLFSVVVGLIGATDPCPREGYDRYTAGEAVMRLIRAEGPSGGILLAGGRNPNRTTADLDPQGAGLGP